MKLYAAPYSPYVQMVLATAAELGVEHGMTLVDCDTWDLPQSLLARNPLAKVPTLELADGAILYDSRTICLYLCESGNGRRLVGAGAAKWTVLTLQSLGVGLMDTMIERFVERWRPVDRQLVEWRARLEERTARTLDRLEQDAPALSPEPDLGTIAVAAALNYVGFRFPEDRWETGRPALAAWHARINRRPSFRRHALADRPAKPAMAADPQVPLAVGTASGR